MIEFEKTLCTLCLMGREFHKKPFFFLSVFSGDLPFDYWIIRLFYIWLILLEKVHVKRWCVEGEIGS